MGLIRTAVITVLLPVALVTVPVAPARASEAAGWRTVTFDAVSLQVPSAWPVWNLVLHPSICPVLDTHAVYLGRPGPDPACPSAAFGKTDAVQLQPIDPQSPDVAQAQLPTVLGGRPAMTNADAAVTHTIIDVLPEAGVEVSLSYGSDPALVRHIESTITVGAGARPVPRAGPAAVQLPPRQLLFRGRGFDTCSAPSAGTMRKWLAAPFRAIGIYIGGINRTCGQVNLTRAWIARIQALGWYYFPMYVGLQSSCEDGHYGLTINPRRAVQQGTAAARDAVAQARWLGIPRGSPIFYDMEPYNKGCNSELITFLNRWDSELHALGYLAGAYWNLKNLATLTGAARKMTEPDAIDYARWDGQPTTTSSYMPARMWTAHQRIHQYLGVIFRTWGGVTLNIDLNKLDLKLPHP